MAIGDALSLREGYTAFSLSTNRGEDHYLPAYRWVLENRLTGEVERLREYAADRAVVLLDYETNADVDDLSSPLSHAALVKSFVEARWPTPDHVPDMRRTG